MKPDAGWESVRPSQKNDSKQIQTKGDGPVNIYDISRECGVSIATVSRVINNSGYVSEKTRQKVLEAIDKYSYSPNAFARGMSKSTMSIAGILCSDSRDPYQAECIYWLQKDLAEAGYTAMLCCTGEERSDLQSYVSLLLSRNVDALVCVGSGFVSGSEKDWGCLVQAAARVPVFLLNGSLDASNIYSIVCDDRRGMEELTALVLQNGAKAPVLALSRQSPSAAEKAEGYLQAMQAAGYDKKQLRLIEIKGHPDDLCHQLEVLYKQEPFDALLCCDDQLAMSAVKFAEKMSLSVPDDLQITGYNGSLLSQLSWPEITSYDSRVQYLCSQTVSALQAVLQKEDFPQKTVYTGKLLPRQTTRMLPEQAD